MTLEQKECRVQMSAVPISESCALSRARTASSCTSPMRAKIAERSRSFISAAAALVKVTARTEDTSALPERMREMIFSIMTNVLPLPADAETRTSPAASMAACCSDVGLRTLINLPSSF